MSSWWDIRDARRRALLSWVGGGVVAIATGGWAVITYVWPHDHGNPVCASGGIAIGGDVRASKVENSASNLTMSKSCDTGGK